MDHSQMYVKKSLELHLFFGRIMKEHAIFLEAGFTKANSDFANAAEGYKNEFENILSRTTNLSRGIISQDVLCSQEIVTLYTLDAEKQTQDLTGIAIDEMITQRQLQLQNSYYCFESYLYSQVQQLNCQVLQLLEDYIHFKESLIHYVSSCQMFTINYPLLLEHILREAKLYYQYLTHYENNNLCDDSIQQIELFWNQIMKEHALFIRGLLDPTENELIQQSHQFAKEYDALLKESCQKNQMVLPKQDDVYSTTKKLRDFKEAGTKGILNCQIRSIIIPLLADHVLREANHYLRLLSCEKDSR